MVNMHVTFATSVYEEEKLNENVRTDMVRELVHEFTACTVSSNGDNKNKSYVSHTA